jgi:uncharacterized protein (TIGR00369 family)
MDERRRIVTWEDPRASRRDAAAASGLDYLLGVKDGRISRPPAAMLVGYRIREVEPGRAVFELEAQECHYNPFSTVHGGILGILLDTTMTAAVLSTLPVEVACATLEMKVNFVRSVTERSGTVRCEASVLHRGSNVATAEGKAFDGQGKLCAHGVATCSIFDAKP